MTSDDLAQLPEADQRQLYDAFHLQVRYHRPPTLQVAINAATIASLTQALNALTRTYAPSCALTGNQDGLGDPQKFSHAVRATPTPIQQHTQTAPYRPY